MRLVGHTPGTSFKIYDYRYRFLPHPEGVFHGGQRLLVFRDQDYLGGYVLSTPPYATISVSGAKLFLQNPDSTETLTLDLSKAPPEQILWNGEISKFDR